VSKSAAGDESSCSDRNRVGCSAFAIVHRLEHHDTQAVMGDEWLFGWREDSALRSTLSRFRNVGREKVAGKKRMARAAEDKTYGVFRPFFNVDVAMHVGRQVRL